MFSASLPNKLNKIYISKGGQYGEIDNDRCALEAGAKLGGGTGGAAPVSLVSPTVVLPSETREKGPPLSFFRFAFLKSQFALPSFEFWLRAWLEATVRVAAADNFDVYCLLVHL